MLSVGKHCRAEVLSSIDSAVFKRNMLEQMRSWMRSCVRSKLASTMDFHGLFKQNQQLASSNWGEAWALLKMLEFAAPLGSVAGFVSRCTTPLAFVLGGVS